MLSIWKSTASIWILRNNPIEANGHLSDSCSVIQWRSRCSLSHGSHGIHGMMVMEKVIVQSWGNLLPNGLTHLQY
jgi:hypothetical protein